MAADLAGMLRAPDPQEAGLGQSFKDLRPITWLEVTQKVFAEVLLRFLGPFAAQ